MKAKKSLESLKNNEKFGTLKQTQENDIKGGRDTFSYTVVIVLGVADVEIEVIDIYY